MSCKNWRLSNTASRTAKDERFIESFKQYVEDLIVNESVREIKGWPAVPREKFEEGGNRLIEAARTVGISETAEELVRQVDMLAKDGLLVPKSEGVPVTSSRDLLSGLKRAIRDMTDYFDGMDLTLYAEIGAFEDRPIIGICLGETKDINMPVWPNVTIFTKMTINNTWDTITNKARGTKKTYQDWVTRVNSYHLLEPKLDNGRATRSNLKFYSSHKPIGGTDKLDELAWSALSLECEDDGEAFSKKYAAICVEDNYSHEIYHNQIAMLEGASTPTEEAAAQLYAISRKESNQFECLSSAYGWRDNKVYKYSDAAEIAFKQLEKVGYDESLWKALDPGDAEKVNAARSEIRSLADAALTNLEAGMGWRAHKEVEDETGLERNYPILHTELQTLYEK